MSNGRQDDSVQLKEEETELQIETETCTLVTVSESRGSEKGNNDLESSLLETETEVGMEATAFSFVGTVFSVKRMRDSSFLWEGGSLFQMV
jgi:hypothetical protein